ncbi:transcription factor IIA L [Brevipalpus obovatus]|uniref:transcription factor IIA L n=1 Tax=Brevipalpus obovatus TaxID=246614 RepID=UPI003D9F48AE
MSTVSEKVYHGVIEEVINGVRDLFLDEGVDEQVLQELKLTWEKKLHETKVLDYAGLLNKTQKPQEVLFGGGGGGGGSTSGSNNQSSALNNTPTLQIQATTSNTMDQRTVLASSRDSRPSTGCTNIVQLDGPNDSSEEEGEDEDDFRENDDDNDDDQNDDEHDYTGEEEEPLNSEDDVSDEDPHELFDTDNVVVCQYDKITRSRNKWKFHLKDGIMNLQGKDYVFQKAIGDAEW